MNNVLVLVRTSSTSAKRERENLVTAGLFAVTGGSVEDGDGPVGQRDQNSPLDVSVDERRRQIIFNACKTWKKLTFVFFFH